MAELSLPEPAYESGDRRAAASRLVLLASIFAIAVCGLVYELVAGTLSSYLLGNSVLYFSLTIGIFLCAMGVGSFCSKYFNSHLLSWFALTEILIGLIGGLMAAIGFAAFTYTELYQPVLAVLSFMVGALIGLEIPLVIRLLKDYSPWSFSLAHVLAVDYAGALAAALLFPLVLAPHLGLIRAAALMGLANLVVAWATIIWFRRQIHRLGDLVGLSCGATLMVAVCFLSAGGLTSFLEDRLYQDEIIYARRTPYQRIVLTHWPIGGDVRLYLDGAIQFSSRDEYRYHEALVHPAMASASRRNQLLILGGGDGMAAREALKYPDVENIDLVDLDGVMLELFSENDLLVGLNDRSLQNPHVRKITMDAMKFLEQASGRYDVILMDLPDPSDVDTGKLYTKSFYRLAARRLAADGVLACQAANPFFAREAFWCIVHTMQREFQGVRPYTVHVPSFGQWGFVLAGGSQMPFPRINPKIETRFLTQEVLESLFVMPRDISEVETDVNTLLNQPLVRLYRKGYAEHFGS
jgi:spermidine synthase